MKRSHLTLPSALLTLCLIYASPSIAIQKEPPTVQYDAMAAEFLPLEKWLQQKDMNSCLSDTHADILFAVDGSESVTMTDFHLMIKSLLVDTISRLEIGVNFVQVGIFVFGSQINQMVPIGKYSNKLELLKAISKLTYDGGYTGMDTAIEGCIAELERRIGETTKTSSVVDIADRKRIVVFVTDGKHSDSSSLYLSDLLGQLHRRVTAVMALGLKKYDQKILLRLVTDPTLLFDPTAYPEYQTALQGLLNMRCAGTCYKFENQEGSVRKVIATLVQYINYLVGNFVSFRKQRATLIDFLRSLNESVISLELDIDRTCNSADNSFLKRIVGLHESIETVTNGSKFAGVNLDAYIGDMIGQINVIQNQVFEQSQRLATEKTKFAGTSLEEEKLKADLQARLDSKIAVRKAQEASLAALESRIESYRKEMMSITESIVKFENVTSELSIRLTRQESVFTSRQLQLTQLTQEHTALVIAESGGEIYLTAMVNKIAMCQAHMRDGYTVLFAIKCSSGADFNSLFSRMDSSFSEVAFNGLTVQQPVYKSPFLHQLHTMGYFSTVTWQFLDSKSTLIGSITMDTSRFELSSLFSKARVSSSYPWVASYVNSIYRASLSDFRAKVDAEFFLVFGDMTRYRVTGSCADIVGVFLVLTTPHRCFPEAKRQSDFPKVYVSASPFGSRINQSVAELRLVTDRLPNVNRPMPTQTTTEEQLSEILLYVKSGAGVLHSMLLTSWWTPAALLSDVDDLSQLARHYKSSLLANLNLENYRAIKMELFDRSGRITMSLKFQGPFNTARSTNQSLSIALSETGVAPDPEKWDWFQARYLVSAQPFDLNATKASRFEFYNGGEFFAIGENLGAERCEQRLYFLTLVDGNTPCTCFNNSVVTPAIYFANGPKARNCDNLVPVDSLRLTGELVKPQVSFFSTDSSGTSVVTSIGA